MLRVPWPFPQGSLPQTWPVDQLVSLGSPTWYNLGISVPQLTVRVSSFAVALTSLLYTESVEAGGITVSIWIHRKSHSLSYLENVKSGILKDFGDHRECDLCSCHLKVEVNCFDKLKRTFHGCKGRRVSLAPLKICFVLFCLFCF